MVIADETKAAIAERLRVLDDSDAFYKEAFALAAKQGIYYIDAAILLDDERESWGLQRKFSSRQTVINFFWKRKQNQK